MLVAIQSTIETANGTVSVAPSASVSIYDATVSPIALTTVWNTRTGDTESPQDLSSNPFTANSDGHFLKYVRPGRYNITATLGVYSQTWYDIIISNGTYYETVSGETGVINNTYPVGDIRRYGADSSGSIDSLSAFNYAISSSNNVIVPQGTYKLTSTLTIPAGVSLIGFGYSDTSSGVDIFRPLIVPTAAVSGVCIDFEGTNNTIKNIQIDGDATSGVIGLRVGNVSLANLCDIDNVQIWNFGGAGGKGLQIVNLVTGVFRNMYICNNQEGLNMGSTSGASLPTTIVFKDCVVRTSVDDGTVIRQGYQISFYNCIFENNGKTGLLVATPASKLINMVFLYGCWFEGNWTSVSSGSAREAEYHLDVDGSASGSELINLTVSDTFFSGGTGGCRALHMDTVYYARIKSPIVHQGLGGAIEATATSGWLHDMQGYTTEFTDNTGNVKVSDALWDELFASWTNFSPTYTPNGSMTYTSVTTSLARYKLIGKILYIEMKVTGTVGGTPSTNIAFDLPGSLSANSSNYISILFVDAGNEESGYLRTDSTTTVSVYRLNGAAFSAGANAGWSFSIVLEVA